MPKKSKVSDEQIIELIEQGLNNSEIARKLNCTLGSINHRIKELRKRHSPLATNREFDLVKYDTVTKEGKWYRVTEVTESNFTIKRIDGVPGKDPAKTYSKEDYIKGLTRLVKKEFSPVKSYVDPSLKSVNTVTENEKSVPEIKETVIEKVETVIDKPVIVPRKEENVPEKDEPVAAAFEPQDYVDSEWGVTPSGKDDFGQKIILEAKADAEKYSSIKSKFIDDITQGKRLVVEDVIGYNNLVIKYGA